MNDIDNLNIPLVIPPVADADGLQFFDAHMDFENDGDDINNDIEENDDLDYHDPILLHFPGPIPFTLHQHHEKYSECRQSISTLQGVLDPEERSMMYLEHQATLLREVWDVHKFSDIQNGTLEELFNTMHKNKDAMEHNMNQIDIDKKFVSELYAFLDITTLSIVESDILIKLIKKRPGNDSIPKDYNTMRRAFQKHVNESIPVVYTSTSLPLSILS
jgi:hypothetical protein